MTPTGIITKHFTWGETRCRCGCEMPLRVQAEVRETAAWAEGVREKLGGKPMGVLSWYRCAEYNRRIRGAPKSQHLLGRAIDFVIESESARAVQAFILGVRLYPKPIRGFGRYPGSTHIDRRVGHAKTWVRPRIWVRP